MVKNLNDFFDNIKRLVKKLQRSDERTKKWWLFGTSAVSVSLIVLIWLLYTGFTMPAIAPPEPEPQAQAQEKDKVGFFGIFKIGLIRVYSDTVSSYESAKSWAKSSIEKTKEYFSQTREIIIEPNPTE